MSVLLQYFGDFQRFEEIVNDALSFNWITVEDLKEFFEACLTFKFFTPKKVTIYEIEDPAIFEADYSLVNYDPLLLSQFPLWSFSLLFRRGDHHFIMFARIYNTDTLEAMNLHYESVGDH